MRPPLIGLDEDDDASTARATARLAPRRASVANIVNRTRLNKKPVPFERGCRSNATANEWRRSGAIDRSRKTRSVKGGGKLTSYYSKLSVSHITNHTVYAYELLYNNWMDRARLERERAQRQRQRQRTDRRAATQRYVNINFSFLSFFRRRASEHATGWGTGEWIAVGVHRKRHAARPRRGAGEGDDEHGKKDANGHRCGWKEFCER